MGIKLRSFSFFIGAIVRRNSREEALFIVVHLGEFLG